ncbi:DUF1842 domain-containing protein [Archangium violaceum]|uniref:DUF1842 domain-containing protein n=1 Tax=Archangium violaceum TaxID=83451 RepID=UPI00194EE117|nr:DUF1842 domain-containing protein [Archangium violaceum]QRN94782.1 DUF1842 domain-containing protein [Archangium violaceum]
MPDESAANLELEKTTRLFKARYEIGTGELGAPDFYIDVNVNTVSKTLTGIGRINQAALPPVDVRTRLEGTYMPMVAEPPSPMRVIVAATGTSVIPWLPDGIQPRGQSNVRLFMLLDPNWKSGSASYEYKGAQGQWLEVMNVPVKRCS